MDDNDDDKTKSGPLEELLQKIEGSLLLAVREHRSSKEFHADKDDLDFLQVKNSMMLSYLIDLTRLSTGEENPELRNRFLETRTALYRMRNLEKKLRYQIDKILAAADASYATAGKTEEDPLQFQPNPEALKEDKEESDSSSDDSDDEDDKEEDSDNEVQEDDLEAAMKTLSMAKQKKKQVGSKGEDEDSDDGIYRAPRLSSTPYTATEEEKRAQQARRFHKRQKASELAQTIRAQFGDTPEQEDMHGGGDFGRQKEAARRLAAREAERTKFEEDAMVRLVPTRKEKKERKRLMREETSNLGAIAADFKNVLGALDEEIDSPEYPDSGTRPSKKRKPKAKNSFQAALHGSKTSKKKKSKRQL